VFFATIGSEIHANVPPTPITFTDYLPQPNQHTIFLDPVTPNDVINTISKIKSKNSLDHNNFSTKLLKLSADNVVIPLTHVINLSLLNGIVPNDMKIAKVIPIFKSGDRAQFNNYRPISILPTFSKILEKIMAKKLFTFLESCNQLYQHQYGFRPGHSTIHPIIQLLNKIAHENDKITKNNTLSVFLDLSKAFDAISHEKLLRKLENMGIRGVANMWFASYLMNRKQFMNIYDTTSSLANISFGVPQGSILGPILFLIYINDIYKATHLDVLCFADDTTISFSSSHIDTLYNTMNIELDLLNNWFMANKLSLNVNKTKYILFRPVSQHKEINNHSLTINNQQIERIINTSNTKSFKFLGIHIDETTSWKFHIYHRCTKISRANYIINKVKRVIPISCLQTLYNSIIQCHINYGIQTWRSSNRIDRVYKLQKKNLFT
jgi:hypothetical protein